MASAQRGAKTKARLPALRLHRDLLVLSTACAPQAVAEAAPAPAAKRAKPAAPAVRAALLCSCLYRLHY